MLIMIVPFIIVVHIDQTIDINFLKGLDQLNCDARILIVSAVGKGVNIPMEKENDCRMGSYVRL